MGKRKTKKERYFTQQELISEMGFTKKLIEKYLPTPELKRNPHYSKGYPMKTWRESVVLRAMKNPALQAEIKIANKKKYELIDLLSSYDYEHLKRRAQNMNRKFIIHVGPTNSGKTYESIEALINSETGVYLGPLRLLALEMFDKLNARNCPCSLITGEESIITENAKHISSTIEMCDFNQKYDIAVIDECQLISDPYRGAHWARALYKVDAENVHVCISPDALDLVADLIRDFNTEPEIIHHERLTPLNYKGLIKNIEDVQDGDALIAFSRKSVLSTAARLEDAGIHASVIYGALPPESRRKEMERFTKGETKVVVATDAIGMGVSLPIKRIIFCQTSKFDGTVTRPLFPDEIKQIAGRAGRFGIYSEGEVLHFEHTDLIQDGLDAEFTPVKVITIPFPREVLDSKFSIQQLLEQWQKFKDTKGLTHEDMSEALNLYKAFKHAKLKASKEEIFTLITCPFDSSNRVLVHMWLEYCKCIINNKRLSPPIVDMTSLESCEDGYKIYDLRHQMLQRHGIPDECTYEREMLADRINQLLKENKSEYIRKCRSCGKVLPVSSSFNICDKCFRKRENDWRYFV